MRLFAHAYPQLMKLTYGTYRPIDLLDFAYRHALDGISIHLLDGEERSLQQMSDDQLRIVSQRAHLVEPGTSRGSGGVGAVFAAPPQSFEHLPE